jgi:hypothetical protein
LKAALALGRVEAILLARSPLVLAGLVGAALVAWYFITRGEPLWWNAGWQIGYGQMILSAVVLAAAQLAAGRARRNNLEDLYNSLPVSVGTRRAGHLLSVLGALPASVTLIAAASALLEWRGVIGNPSLAALAAGVLLVIAGGAIGVMLGLRFPHPFVGLLGAVVWVVPFSQSNRFNGAVTWLFPWVEPQQLGQFPQPVPGYPPAAAHAAELAGVAALAGVVALAWRAQPGIQRRALLAVGAVALAVACLAGAAELKPIPTADLNHLVAEAATPSSFQTCQTANRVRYCLYPGFASLQSSLEGPVDAVLGYVPARTGPALTIEQATTWSLDDASITHGHSEAQLAIWAAELNNAPANATSASTIYLNVGTWPPSGTAAAAAARFDLAFGAAEWAVGLPPSTGSPDPATQCVPLDQAREAIAIWLALESTHTKVTGVQVVGGGYRGPAVIQVNDNPVVAWVYPGANSGDLASTGLPTTAAGYLLAKAMTGLPSATVTRVLDRNWATWTNWHSTDSQLAAALGIPMPAVPSINPTPGPGQIIGNAPAGTSIPSQPVCTT